MPIYEYICTSCNAEQEVIQKVSAAPLKNCPQCQKDSLVKKTSMSAFHLKGGGWYKDGYAEAGAKTTAKENKKSDPKNSATKPESSKSKSPESSKNSTTKAS
jgi:putative FmdB family regulatory protein